MFMFRKNKICYAISGLSFGLAVLARYPSAVFMLPFLIYCFIMILKKRNIRDNLTFAFLSILPVAVWLMRNLFVLNKILPGGYMSVTASLNKSLFYLISNLAKQLFVITPVALTILFPFAVIGIFNIFKEKKLIWKLFLAGCCINYLFFSWWYVVGGVTIMIRFLVSTIPLLTILSIKGLFSIKRIKYDTKKIIMAITLIMFIFATMFINYGFFKDKTDDIIKFRPIYTQKSYHRVQAISWINTNVPENSIIVTRFYDVDLMRGIDQCIPPLLRADLEYTIIKNNFEPYIKNYFLSYRLKENKDYLNQKEIYFISELNIAESKKAITKEINQSLTLEEMFKSKQDPIVYIYKIHKNEV